MDYPVVASSPESVALGSAQGLLVNAITEFNYRAANAHRVSDDAQRAAEESFLARWSQQLDAEQARLTLWARDLQRRQIESGLLVPQPDGSFAVRPPTPAATVAKRVGWSVAGALALIALLTGQLAGLLALAAMIGVSWLAVRALIRAGNPRGSTVGAQTSGEAALVAARVAAEQAAEADAAAAAQRLAEQQAEAARRREEALDRARARARTDDDGEWV